MTRPPTISDIVRRINDLPGPPTVAGQAPPPRVRVNITPYARLAKYGGRSPWPPRQRNDFTTPRLRRMS